jgi:hypothetical protein
MLRAIEQICFRQIRITLKPFCIVLSEIKQPLLTTIYLDLVFYGFQRITLELSRGA